jgi:hypothetical protein
MADEKKADDVEKLLSEQKLLEDRKQALIDDLLKQKDAAIAAFDEKLEKLGYHATKSGRSKRNHHKKVAAADTKLAAKSEKKA